jgi:dehydrogenase/reductase SDR family protein 12
MIQLEHDFIVERPARECLLFAADPRRRPEWDPSVLSVRKLSAGGLIAGSRFEITRALGSNRLSLRCTLETLDPPHHAELHGVGEGIHIIDHVRCTALGEQRTRVHWQTDIDLQRGERLLRPLLRRQGRRAIRNLQRALRPLTVRTRLGWGGRMADRLLLPGAARFTGQGFRMAGLPPVVDRMDGQLVVLTGATSGIGLAAAEMLSRLGAELVLVGRNSERLQQVRQQLLDDGAARVDTEAADLLDLDEVRALALRLRQAYPLIDVLINNAGALFAERALTPQGHERALAVNLLTPWLLMQHLRPALAAAGAGRIINVASGGMYLTPLDMDDLRYEKARYDGPTAYARAKRMLVVLGQRMAADFAGDGIAVHAMHPGWADTPGVESSLPSFHRIMRPLLRNASEGADTLVWLAADPGGTDGGQFWFDRAPHGIDLIPGTRIRRDEVDTLDGYFRTLVAPYLP